MSIPASVVIRRQNKFRSLTTKQPYKKGEVILPIRPELVSKRPTIYTVQVDRTRHVEVKQLASMNHSCNPNTILDTTLMMVFAACDIAAGEELTFFYPSTEWEMCAPFVCLCGARNCIHVVAGARFLQFSTLQHYYLNPHIREEIVKLLKKTEQR